MTALGGGGGGGEAAQRIEDLTTLLICLVNMMGGSVVVSDVDIHNAMDHSLNTYRMEDMRFVLTMKEKK